MNKFLGIGRLTRDPEVRDANGTLVARYTLAVDRPYSRGEEKQADFISCVAFGKAGEFAQRYLEKGKKIAVEGRIQTGKYQNKDGQTVYTTDVIVDRHEFVESRNASNPESENDNSTNPLPIQDGFMNVSSDVEEEMPFA